MWLMSDTEALAFIAIVALMLAVAVVLVIAQMSAPMVVERLQR